MRCDQMQVTDWASLTPGPTKKAVPHDYVQLSTTHLAIDALAAVPSSQPLPVPLKVSHLVQLAGDKGLLEHSVCNLRFSCLC
jgi:hypothetical protein